MKWSRLLLFLVASLFSSAAFAFTNPVPFLNQPLIPGSIKPGHAGFTMAVHGANFAPGAVLQWNGSPRSTTIVDSELLRAAIPASDVSSAGTAMITVVNPAPGGGRSNVAYFTVRDPASSVAFTFSKISGPLQSEATAVGDFNNDGNLDFAVAYWNSPDFKIELFTGNGDGTFQSPIVTTIVSTPLSLILPRTLQAADFNGDGKLDLVTNYGQCQGGGGPAEWMVLLNNGDGTFKESYTPTLVGGIQSMFTIADYNRDGNLDLAFMNGYEPFQVVIYLGNGDGTFEPGYTKLMGSCCSAPATGDYNGDGKLDLGVETGQALVTFLGKGDGTFTFLNFYSQPFGGGFNTTLTADLNHDGKLDLLEEQASLHVYLGDGRGGFTAGAGYTPVFFSPTDVQDMNGDGNLDVVGPGSTVSFSKPDSLVWLGKGDGTFGSPITVSNITALAVGDFNDDGKLDFLALDNLGNLGIAFQN